MSIDGWQWHPPVFTIVEFLLPHGCCDKTFRGTNKTIRIDIKVYIKKKVEFPLHRRAKELSVCDIKPHEKWVCGSSALINVDQISNYSEFLIKLALEVEFEVAESLTIWLLDSALSLPGTTSFGKQGLPRVSAPLTEILTTFSATLRKAWNFRGREMRLPTRKT